MTIDAIYIPWIFLALALIAACLIG